MSRRAPDLTIEQRQFIYDLYHEDVKPSAIRNRFNAEFGFGVALSTITKFSKDHNVPGRPDTGEEEEEESGSGGVEDIRLEEVDAKDLRKRTGENLPKGEFIAIKEDIPDEDIDRFVKAYDGVLSDESRATAWELLSQAYQRGYTRFYIKDKEFV